ncbi:Lar family restriction alleviation protein [Sphingomonas sp. RHCKR47]|uniref:Lar family restriction alleviation protein n=1 Tax=Sphingomonas citricola TaxID=2862498 RepID=UPI001C68694E|nr:Lar family restriction alleviation protein [Sphingomonas citricola]MBW6523473.1 Lar family restriction alleviation protein [Sphingomonas citricola]
MTDATLPESTNSPAASLTSEPEKLLPCPFCAGPGHLRHSIFEIDAGWHVVCHGRKDCPLYCSEPYQVHGSEADAIAAWNTRLSSPVSGTDMVERLVQAMWASEDEPGTLDESGRRGTFERLAHAALSTPATLDNTAVEGQPARVYLASRFSRRHECHALAQVLKAAGHSIASEWVQADQESVPVVGPSDTAAPEYREYWGKLDLQNVRDCDWLISLQEPERSGGRGGRHVEFGIAAALNKRLTIIGPRETVFHHLPNVEHFDTVEALVATLTAKTEKAE